MTTEPLNVEEPAAVEKPAVDVDGLVAELAKFGVENVSDLSGKLEAGTQAGRLAQLLGDERKRSAELESQLRTPPNPAPRQDFMDYGEGQTIDIEAAIERNVTKSVKAVLDAEKQAQHNAYQANLQKWNHIQQDANFGLVKEVWDEKMKDPNFVYKVQNNIVDPVQEYNNTVVGYMKKLLKQSHDTIKTMQGGPQPAPHTEQGGRMPANMVSETPAGTDAEKNMAAMKERTDKGHIMTVEEELGLLDNLFGSTEPL